jgi:hypothetical protein
MVKTVASEEDISINQFIASAVAEKLSALTTEKYIEARAVRASKDKFNSALSKVPNSEPTEIDRI